MKLSSYSLMTGLMTALCLSTSMQANAGHGAANGGDGILIDGKPYLLDLVEFGIEQKSMLKDVEPQCAFIPSLEKAFQIPQLKPETRAVALRVLAVLCEASPLLAYRAAAATNDLYFNWVNLSLFDIKDEETPIEYNPKSIVQLAARQGVKILIDSKLWAKLDERNRAGLILHEIFYSMTTLQAIPAEPKKYTYKQSSADAREIVGTLFANKLNDGSKQRLANTLRKIDAESIRDKNPFVENANGGMYSLSFDLTALNVTRPWKWLVWNDSSFVAQVQDTCYQLSENKKFLPNLKVPEPGMDSSRIRIEKTFYTNDIQSYVEADGESRNTKNILTLGYRTEADKQAAQDFWNLLYSPDFNMDSCVAFFDRFQ